jgi:hypothetical protein
MAKHIVNHLAFSDAAPTLGGASTVYNPAGPQTGPDPGGPPRYVQPKGVLRTKNVTSAPGLTNKRF